MKERLQPVDDRDVVAAPAPPSPVPPEPANPMDLPLLQGGNRAAAKLLGDSAGPAHPLAPMRMPAAPAQIPAPTTPQEAPAQPEHSWVDDLPEHIAAQIEAMDDKSYAAEQKALAAGPNQQTLDRRTASRQAFRRTMTYLFGSDDAARLHFAEVRERNLGGPLWVHTSTWERLLAARKLVEDQGIPMPATDVGLGMRGFHLEAKLRGPTMFTHAVGFAVDWRATRAPHIEDAGLIKLLQVVRGGDEHIPTVDLAMGPQQQLNLIEQMGQGKAKAADSQKLLDQLEKEYNRLVEDSEKFKTDLPAPNIEQLRKLTATVTAAHARMGRKGMKAEEKAKAQEDFKAAHDEAATHLAEVFAPWVTKLDTQIAELDKVAKDAGVDLDHLIGPGGRAERGDHITALQKRRDTLKVKARLNLDGLVAAEHDTLALAAKADADRAFLGSDHEDWAGELTQISAGAQQAAAATTPHKEELAKLLGKPVPEVKPPTPPKVTKVDEKTMAALRKEADPIVAKATKAVATAGETVTTSTNTETELTGTRTALAADEEYTKQKTDELGGPGPDGPKKKAQGAAEVKRLLDTKLQLIVLRRIKDGLLNDTGGFVFNFAADSSYKNPGVSQLLSANGGYFTPDAEPDAKAAERAKKGLADDQHGFGLPFFKAMVSSGFEPGIVWAQNSDPMHFELAEGRKELSSLGSSSLTAGVELAATEQKQREADAAAAQAAAAKAAAEQQEKDKAGR